MQRSIVVALIVAACVTPDESRVTSAVTQCSTQTIEGLDVFSGTGVIDWPMVKASGRQFVFIKATQGDYNKQSTFQAQWSGALAAGLLRSPYHFFDATIDGVTQANWFLNEIAQFGGLQPGDLPPLLDLECPTSSSQTATQPDCEYTGNSGWVATATLSQRVFDWLATVKQATGRTPLIYSYPSWFADVGFTDPALAAFPLFIAKYSSCALVPAPWTQAVFWQYSATTTVPGVSAPADVDRFFGSAADLGTLTGATPDAGVAPADAPGASPDAGNAGAEAAGCGCRSGGGSSICVVVVVLLVVRRRARR